jgi:hypothetical protein
MTCIHQPIDLNTLHLLVLFVSLPLLLVGCVDKSLDGYVPASSFSKKGFAKNREQALTNRGKVIKVWGYVDGANVFSKEWKDNSPEKWRFKLKAKPWEDAGQSFSIHVPVDDGHDELVTLFVANHLINKPTRVFVTGRVSTFDAPMNLIRKTGLYMEVNSSKDILLEVPAKE